MQSKENLIREYIDGLEAVKQSIFKIIMTERYQYIMYSWNYGIELVDLFGEPISYVCPELKRRISEALLWDDRIKGVDNFIFDFPQKSLYEDISPAPYNAKLEIPLKQSLHKLLSE